MSRQIEMRPNAPHDARLHGERIGACDHENAIRRQMRSARIKHRPGIRHMLDRMPKCYHIVFATLSREDFDGVRALNTTNANMII